MNTRSIPRLDVKNAFVIKGVHLECLRKVGNPEDMATRYYKQGADEIIYMDIVASLYGRNTILEILEKASRHIFIPLAVGGGVRSVEDIRRVLRAGADRVAINSAAIENPSLLNEASKKFGNQCIIGSIEAIYRNGFWEAMYNNGRECSGRNAVEWAKEMEERGCGELIITSVDREGTGKGLDIPLNRAISGAVNIPVIACGGAGSPADVTEIIYKAGVDAVALSRVLHFDKCTVKDIKTAYQINDCVVTKGYT